MAFFKTTHIATKAEVIIKNEVGYPVNFQLRRLIRNITKQVLERDGNEYDVALFFMLGQLSTLGASAKTQEFVGTKCVLLESLLLYTNFPDDEYKEQIREIKSKTGSVSGYIGEDKDGVLDGYGLADDGKFNGQGTHTHANGDKYVGEWKDGKMHGQGTYTHASGSKYVGEWKDDEKHGQGTYTHANGDKYVGEWKDGNWHGQGTATLANGTKYVGEWKDNSKHGQGTYTSASGTVKEGIWINGELVEDHGNPDLFRDTNSTDVDRTVSEKDDSENDIEFRLAKLKELEEKGLLSEEEASEKRKHILDSL